jgi:transposase
MKTLSTEALRAASLLATGASEQQVAEQIGKSRSWVQSLKRRDDFKLALEGARLGADNALKDALQQFKVLNVEEYLEELRKYNRLHYEEGYKYLNLGKKMLEICEQRVANLDPADLSIQGFCGLAKITQITFDYGSELVAESLGLNKFINYTMEEMANEE